MLELSVWFSDHLKQNFFTNSTAVDERVNLLVILIFIRNAFTKTKSFDILWNRHHVLSGDEQTSYVRMLLQHLILFIADSVENVNPWIDGNPITAIVNGLGFGNNCFTT